jgi:4-amino-4-deoxy-L-arabinose transferase-like glycosyltransferase
LLILILWVIVQGIFFYRNGIILHGEPEKYIYQANHLLTKGTLSSSNFWLYSTQIFLIAFAFKTSLGFGFVLIVQLLANLAATFAVFEFARKIFNVRVAIIHAGLLILNFPLQDFNTYMQTDSLFYSFTIIFACYLFSLEKLTPGNVARMLAFLFLICVTRPTGLLFIPPTFLFLFYKFFRSISVFYKTVLVVIVGAGFLFFLNAALGSGGELDFMLPFRDERIICGVPTLPGFIPIKTADDGNSLYGLMYYIFHNPGQFLRLAALRTKAFFLLTRPYFSNGHNFFLISYFYPIFILAVLGIRYWVKHNPYLLMYCVSAILMMWITVILTCDDWHNRFFLTIVPYFNFLSLPFFYNLTRRKLSNE